MSYNRQQFLFQKQLSLGAQGESLILKHYHTPLVPETQDRRWDCKCVITGHKIEIKTDTYDISSTPFFFLERLSNRDTGTQGGPWRAVKDRVPVYVYLFIKNSRYYVLKDLPKFIKAVEKHIKKNDLKPIPIFNKGWVTEGYKIDRLEFQKFWTLYEFNPDTDKRAVPVRLLSEELDLGKETT